MILYPCFHSSKVEKVQVTIKAPLNPLTGRPWNPNKTARLILRAIKRDGFVTIASLAEKLQMSPSGVDRNLTLLKITGLIRRVGPDRGGYWEAVKGGAE